MSIEKKYQKKNLHQHILDRPDSYIGSIKPINEDLWIWDKDNEKMIKKNIKYAPALLKIFDEILVNAIDQSVMDSTLSFIKVNINDQNNEINISNNGKGIEVEIHKDHQIYVPELIFGHLLTSSNYDDSKERITGGLNGFGSKLTNIYSEYFKIETVCNGKKFTQEYLNNMYKKTKPKISNTDKSEGFVSITFKPDLKRFGFQNLTPDLIALFEKRVIDASVCTNSKVKVYLNKKIIKQKNFEKYIDLYLKNDTKKIYIKLNNCNGNSSHSNFNYFWELVICMNDHFEQVSFVNGINTIHGGNHVKSILDSIIKKLTIFIKSKNSYKDINIKSNYIKDHLFVFLKSIINKPSFSSQTKEVLTTPYKDFGFTFEIQDDFIKKLSKIGLVDEIIQFSKFKENKDLLKTNGSNKKKMIRIPKLDDANYAGSKESNKCCLMLCEGDSAKNFCISGLTILKRDYYGVFPLKGKPLNVREATTKQLLDNTEINNIKKILGLEHGKKYTNLSELRYGSILAITDSDEDGHHIFSLIINMFELWWPELIKLGFITSFLTPIVKINQHQNKKVINFYTLQDYENWKKDNVDNLKLWKHKYYKGLGTNTKLDALEYFKNLNKLRVKYFYDEDTHENVLLAFEKSKSDQRKEWLRKYNRNIYLDKKNLNVSISDFINKELIHFSQYDIQRSIPNVIDGLKISQRKILYTCFKKNLKDEDHEIKVAQLGGAVAEITDYKHGEQSLFGAIINLAQNFVGSNNINLLFPDGQFGSRLKHGNAASPRYIFTYLNPITYKIFHQDDFPLLDYLEEEGKKIEPKYYIPIIPMVLINNNQGIGTGFSSDCPQYNPEDIINNLFCLIENKEMKDIIPWYKGFKGKIIKESYSKFICKGNYVITNKMTLEINEIPIGVWTENYVEMLDKMVDENKIKSYDKKYDDENIKFIIKLNEEYDNKDKLEKDFKLTKNINLTNIHLFDKNEKIKKYDCPLDIIKDFYETRIEYYHKRKEYTLKILKEEYLCLESKRKFIELVIDKKIKVFKELKTKIFDSIKEYSLPIINQSYDFYIKIPLTSFTKEKVDDLTEKCLNKKEEIDKIEKTTIIEMYKNDLIELKKELTKYK
jgi:DNA topoisomerase-2